MRPDDAAKVFEAAEAALDDDLHCGEFGIKHRFIGRRLNTLKGLTFYKVICRVRQNEPERFITNPLHQMPGLNS